MAALGPNPLFWCLPFAVNKEGNGIDFKVKRIVKEPILTNNDIEGDGKDSLVKSRKESNVESQTVNTDKSIKFVTHNDYEV